MNLKVKVTPLMVETFNYLLNNYYVLYYFSFLIISFLIERYYLNNNISILSLHPGSVFVIIAKVLVMIVQFALIRHVAIGVPLNLTNILMAFTTRVFWRYIGIIGLAILLSMLIGFIIGSIFTMNQITFHLLQETHTYSQPDLTLIYCTTFASLALTYITVPISFLVSTFIAISSVSVACDQKNWRKISWAGAQHNLIRYTFAVMVFIVISTVFYYLSSYVIANMILSLSDVSFEMALYTLLFIFTSIITLFFHAGTTIFTTKFSRAIADKYNTGISS